MNNKINDRPVLFALVCCFTATLLPGLTSAGAYIFAGEDNDRLNVITHPSGYTPAGGSLNVEVCIDASAEDAADMVIPVQNVLKTINGMLAETPNLFFGDNNNIPSNAYDFESLALHEIGHCTGLGHPNLGYDQGIVEGANQDFTASGDGANDTFSFNAGTDSIIGSNDDQRDDDQNLHWFEIDNNNPFEEVVNPDSSNYSRDLADLPDGHSFPANASRDVGGPLGFSNTEAVMQQGQFNDEEQRSLQADDIATYEMAMTGLDETSGTADDYTFHMVYGGIRADTSNCDIVVKSDEATSFGVCSTGAIAYGSAPNHFIIDSAVVSYNPNINMFFNPVAADCTADDNDLTVDNETNNDKRYHEACSSITYGPAYTVGANGIVTAIAPEITLGPDTTINGTFTAIVATP